MSQRKSSWIVLSLVLLVSLVLSACQTATVVPTQAPATAAPAKPTTPPEPTKPPATATAVPPTATKAPTVFRIAITADIDSFDPAGSRSLVVGNVVDYMVETLVKADKTGKVVPSLAKSWEFSKDGTEITFKLQEGVKFSDGSAFDAAAVKFNLDRILDPNVTMPGRAAYTPIKETTVVDATTVKVKLSAANGSLVPSLTFTNAGIVSPKSMPKDSENYKALKLNAPVGTGPYIFKEYVKGERVVVTKNANYWGAKPYYDEVVFRVVPDAATRESLILSGQVDMTTAVPITDIAALDKNSAVKVVNAKSNRLIFIGLNTTSKYLDNPKVRQAFNYAINKDEIIKSLLLGNATAVDSPMVQGFFGYCKTGPYAYDPAKAKQLLKEANIPAGTKFKFLSPTGRYLADFQVSQAIAGYLKEVGIEVELTTSDYTTFIGTVLKPQKEAVIDMHMLGWASTHMYGSHTTEMFYSKNAPPNGFAATYYNKPEVDKLIDQAISEPDATKSADYFCQANKIIWEDAPWIFLYTQNFQMVHSAKVGNLFLTPSEKFDAIYAEPAK